MAHQQESFLPFSSRQSLSCCLSHVAKGSTPKPCGPFPHFRTSWFSSFTSEPHGPLSIYLLQNLVGLLFPSQQGLSCFLSHVAKGSTPKPRGPNHPLWLPRLGLNPSTHLPLQPHFRLLLQSATPASIPVFFQHPRIFPALLGCHSKSGQVWPHGVEPIISKLSRRCCNQRGLPPSYILGGSHSYPPGSKQGHSYLTYL